MLLITSDALPLVDYSFLGGSLPTTFSFARASTGARVNASKSFVAMGIDVPRFDYDLVTGGPLGLLYESQSTNYIKNSTMQGAVAGTPGTLPTNWSTYSAGSSLTREVVGVGTEYGMPYIDLRLYGTPVASNGYQLFFEPTSGITGVQGETFTLSVFVRYVAGSLSNVTPIRLSIDEYDSTSGYEAGGNAIVTIPEDMPSSPLYYTRPLSDVDTDRVRGVVQVSTTTGQAVDVTLRFYQPQMEKQSSASSPIPTSGSSVTRAADALSFNIPHGADTLRYVFDDSSTQDVAVSAGVYAVPTDIDRLRIKRIFSL